MTSGSERRGEAQRWTDEEAREAFHEAAWPREQTWMAGSYVLTVGRALLGTRDRAEKAEALVAVLTNRTEVLKAECRAHRTQLDSRGTVPHTAWCQMMDSLDRARAATDAALGGEAL